MAKTSTLISDKFSIKGINTRKNHGNTNSGSNFIIVNKDLLFDNIFCKSFVVVIPILCGECKPDIMSNTFKYNGGIRLR